MLYAKQWNIPFVVAKHIHITNLSVSKTTCLLSTAVATWIDVIIKSDHLRNNPLISNAFYVLVYFL